VKRKVHPSKKRVALQRKFAYTMKLLLTYLKRSKNLVLGALVLAAVNQSFSLLDPFISGKLIDQLGVQHAQYAGDSGRFMKDLTVYLLLLVGVAMVSRLAKNFQDYVTSLITQAHGCNDVYRWCSPFTRTSLRSF
jgi:ATP-binding cassette, subfamily B, bacterial